MYQRNRGACRRNTVFEDEALGHIVGTIQEKLLDPRNVERLRQELHRQVKTAGGKSNANSLRKKLGAVDAKLSKAKRRLVEVDADMLDVVQEQLRDLRQQHERLQSSLKAAEQPPRRRIAEADETIDRAVGMLQRLQDVFAKADATNQREVIQQTLARIDVLAERDLHHGQRPYRLEVFRHASPVPAL